LRIFELRKEEIVGGRRKLNNEEHHNLHSPPNIIRKNKSRIMKWERHVARMGITAGSCEHGNELSGFIERWKFLERPSNCWLLKKNSAPWG
jgi:hypothetical protein